MMHITPLGPCLDHRVVCQGPINKLESWARRAEADIALVEALRGAPLAAADSVAAALPLAVHTDDRGRTVLSRYAHPSLVAVSAAQRSPGLGHVSRRHCLAVQQACPWFASSEGVSPS